MAAMAIVVAMAVVAVGVAGAATTAEDPTVEIAYEPSTPTTDEPVAFAVSTSGFNFSVVEIQWYVDGSPTATGETFEYTFVDGGGHNVTAVATDANGTSARDTVDVAVSAGNEPPSPGAIGFINCRPSCSGEPSLAQPGDDALTLTYDRYPRLQLVAPDSSDRDGEVVAYAWEFDGQTIGSGQEVEITPDGPGSYDVTLQVTDDDGATQSRTVSLELETGNTAPDIGPIGFVPCTPECSGDPIFPTEVDAAGQEDLTVAYGEFQSVQMVAPEATDPDGEIAEWRWEVEDITVAQAATAQHTFETSGDFNVALTVSDDAGDSTRQSVFIDVNRPPTVEVASVPDTVTVNESATFEASPSDPDGTVEAVEWAVDGEAVGSGTELAHAFSSVGTHELSVTVTDDDEFTGSATVEVEVQEASGGGGLGILPILALVLLVLLGVAAGGYLYARQ